MKKKSEKKKKGVVLVFGVTKNYTFALANTLIGLKKYNKKFWDDIVVYHDGIAEYEKKCINEILLVQFVDLSESEYFKRIEKTELDVLAKYSVATFYRYECLRLLSEYHKVIWNDVDILIKGDISGLLEYGEKSGLAFSMALPHFVMGSSLKKMLDEYKMFAPLWNVGIMVLTDKLTNYRKIYEWCVDATEKYNDVLLWPDLAVLNMVLQEFEIEPENIDGEKYVCLPMSKNAVNASILHAYGDKKFWNNLEYMDKCHEWIENAILWSKVLYKEAQSRTPLVSCVMSCYERYDYLEESIESLLAQTYPNFEIIVVLEKSKTQKKIREVLKDIDDERIVIIDNKEKLGFPASLNVGIDAARGEYIARMDDDDVAMPCRFSRQVKFLEDNPKVGVVGSDMVVFGREKGYAPTYTSNDYIKAVTIVESPFKHPTVMMRKKILDKYCLQYDPNYFTEDYELWSRMVYLTESANIAEPLVCYRSHNQQATSSGTNNNELKIHSSHKRIMANQLKKYLNIELSDNELELLQTRKNYVNSIIDKEGMNGMREEAVKKILEANSRKKEYDEDILDYILNYRVPGEFRVIPDYILEQKQKEAENDSNKKIKKMVKSVLGPVVKPFYARLVDRMENLMIEHDNAMQSDLQWQIDEIKKQKNH